MEMTVNDLPRDIPPLAAKAQAIADEAGFLLSCESRTGGLLRTLAAAKPGGRILEVGAGVGVGTAWLLAGMDDQATLVTLEIDEEAADIVRRLFAAEPQVEVVHEDATAWLETYAGPPFDLVFVDTTVTKFDRRELLLRHMAPGALLVADDLVPGPTWTAAHPARVERFLDELPREPALVTTLMTWASGLAVAARR
jgi:predicted O-methyltransferase YrrM